MKIIIVNIRYFVSGGPERYLFNVKQLLEKNGHEVIPFSIKNKLNKPTEYDRYFLNPIGEDEEVYFREYKKTNLKTILRSFSRMFYSFEAKRKLNRLIRDVKPDIIYVLLYQNKISPSIFSAAAKNKVPVVHRISDFGNICANNIFYRPKQKDICERCLTGSKINAVINKCVHESYVYSAIKAASLKFQELIGVSRKIQAFVVPSKFTLGKLKVYGLPEHKLVHIPTFFNFQLITPDLPVTYEPFALYIGRIDADKGLMTLVKAFVNTGHNLKIVGFSGTGYEEELKEYLKDKDHKIEFLGKKEFSDIQVYLSKCSFTIVPSEWYDNFPNTILESSAFRKCTVASNTGSLKELVIDHETGLLFRIKDVEDLKEKAAYLFNNNAVCRELGNKAYQVLNEEYSAEQHYARLSGLFGSVIDNYKGKAMPEGRVIPLQS